MFGPLDESLRGACCIYVIWGINPETDEVRQYNGRTVNAYVRRNEHRKDLRKGTHCNVHLQRFHDKYGAECLVFRPFIGTKPGRAKMAETKVREFFQQDDQHVAFNLLDSSCGLDSESAREMGAANRGKKHPADCVHCAALRGKHLSDETKALIGTAKIGENNYNFGKKHSAETRAKIGAAQKARWARRAAAEAAK